MNGNERLEFDGHTITYAGVSVSAELFKFFADIANQGRLFHPYEWHQHGNLEPHLGCDRGDDRGAEGGYFLFRPKQWLHRTGLRLRIRKRLHSDFAERQRLDHRGLDDHHLVTIDKPHSPGRQIALNAVISVALSFVGMSTTLLIAGHSWVKDSGANDRQIAVNTVRLDRLEANIVGRAAYTELEGRVQHLEAGVVTREEMNG